MVDAPQLAKDQVISALVLAFSRSQLCEIVGTDALRSILKADYVSMVNEGVFSLQKLWELLEEQPGFSPAAAMPPLCLFKSWEVRLRMPIELPTALLGLSASQAADYASQCRVRQDELEQALTLSSVVAAPQVPAKDESAPAAAYVPPPMSPARRGLLLGLGVVTLAALGYTGYSVYSNSGGAPFRPLVAADFAGEIPLKDAKRLGTQVGATLSDESWLARPEAEKRKQLTLALEQLNVHGLESLVVLDARKQIRATAQFFGQPRQVVCGFP
jgi:hypothetical protein